MDHAEILHRLRGLNTAIEEAGEHFAGYSNLMLSSNWFNGERPIFAMISIQYFHRGRMVHPIHWQKSKYFADPAQALSWMETEIIPMLSPESVLANERARIDRERAEIDAIT